MFAFSDPLQLVSLSLGLFIGLLYALIAFRDDAKSPGFLNHPKVAYLRFALVGFVAIMISDLKAVADNTPPNERLFMLGDYVSTLVIGALIAIVGSILTIFTIVQSRARHYPALKGMAADAVFEYLNYGYKAYRERTDGLVKSRPDGHTSPDAALGEIGHSLAVLAVQIGNENRPRELSAINRDIDLVLSGIESVVKLFSYGSTGLEIESNYMVRKRHDQVDQHKVRFVGRRKLADFHYFLSLQRYLRKSGPDVCIPVERADQAQRLLPGAPQAAAEMATACVSPKKLRFRPKVEKDQKTEVETFFKDVSYNSVLSVPIAHERDIIGVVNVESNLADVVGKGPEVVREIGRALAPFCIIMGRLMSEAEATHGARA